MKEIGFDLGGAVEKTLKPHNVPYRGDNTAGITDYTFMGFPDGVVTVIFNRSGMEVRVPSVFGISYYVDDDLGANIISFADMNISSAFVNSNEKAYTAANNLIAEFQRGKWQRFIPDNCPFVTGRSTILGLQGTIEDRKDVCPIDPNLKLSVDDFYLLSSEGAVWMWFADHRIATLEVSSRLSGEGKESSYSINIKFETLESYEFYDRQSEAEWIKDRGEEGAKESAKKVAAEIKLLEEAALKRGDKVLPRP